MKEYVKKTSCRLCDSKKISKVLKLEDSALCDSYSKQKVDIKKYPLEDIPLDQTPVESRPDVLIYSSEIVLSELVLSGWPLCRL